MGLWITSEEAQRREELREEGRKASQVVIFEPGIEGRLRAQGEVKGEHLRSEDTCEGASESVRRPCGREEGGRKAPGTVIPGYEGWMC